MTRYLSGLCVAGLGLCGGGWLIAAAAAFGGESGGAARQVNLATGACLLVVSSAGLASWAVAWHRRLRADGVLPARVADDGLLSGGAAVSAGMLRETAARGRVPGAAGPPDLAVPPAAATWRADDELLAVAESEEAWW